MADQDTPRRGRPRKFDRKVALRRALELFWTHGYDGASMTQLVKAMGINSPSLYSTFGSKEDLFREAIALYVSTDGGLAWQSLDEAPDLVSAIRGLLLISIDTFFKADPPRGCLVILGSNHLDWSNPPVRSFLRDARARFRDKLAKRIERAISEGDTSPATDVHALADTITAFFCGISIAVTDGVAKEELTRSVDLFCSQLFSK